jgi:hypothetical protein
MIQNNFLKGYKIFSKIFLVSFFSVISCSSNDDGSKKPDPVDNKEEPEEIKHSPIGDVVGQITVGYQGWFACIGDGSPINGWWHWAPSMSKIPSELNKGIKSWPDLTGYEKTYATGFKNLGNGAPASLFSNYDYQTTELHFKWMKEYGIHTAALQRFNPTGGEGPIRDNITEKVKTAAEANGVKFYIMYDVSNWTNMQEELKSDWLNKMKAYTNSSSYAKQNGKPVVGIWGFGFNDQKHAFSASVCKEVIQWFKAQGCYVMGGVPTYWRTGVNDSRSDFSDTYASFDMISPWMVGRIATMADSDQFYVNINVPDEKYCFSKGIDYQPCVMPGDLQARQRVHGDFMWRQFFNMVRSGCQGIYISMFDEFNEGNQIAKTAVSVDGVPQDSGILALDEDGTPCSSDYYLRLTNDGGKMLRKESELTAVRKTATK